MIVKYRIKKREEFQKVIKQGQKVYKPSITLYFIDNDLGYTRFGISVPTKAGCAVIRGKIRRQVRSIIGQLSTYKESLDVVLVPSKGYDIENFLNTKNHIQGLFYKIGIYSEKNN